MKHPSGQRTAKPSSPESGTGWRDSVSYTHLDVYKRQVLATAGDTHLGGDDFDQRIMDYLVAEFKKAEGIDQIGRAHV